MSGIAVSLTAYLSVANSGTPYPIASATPSGLVDNSARTSPQIRTLDQLHPVTMLFKSGYRNHLIHLRGSLQFTYVLEFHLLSEKMAENFQLRKLYVFERMGVKPKHRKMNSGHAQTDYNDQIFR